jgi:O-antigen biosynthesis protein
VPMIDIIIPVHKGAAATRRCVGSVLAGGPAAPFETIVVDDASPVPEIPPYLDELVREGRITLLRNERNLGFVQSVNRGMAQHPDRDVVLLNSDTEVANDWLDRLQGAACREPDIGTATPFSNNATICSYPFEGWTGGLPGTLGLAALDRVFASANTARTVDLPTAVGFCMYIRRACLDHIGAFDAERFGRGYGEENDFCMRAAKAGWRSVLAADVFVFHEGAVSFAGEKGALTESAGATLVAKHPDYPRKVRDFMLRDPVRTLREPIDAARLAHGADEAASVHAEQAVERSLLVARLAQAETFADQRDAAIAHAEAIVAERNAEFSTLLAEIENLRAGLTHAEALAADRQQQLEHIRGLRAWKLLSRLMRAK